MFRDQNIPGSSPIIQKLLGSGDILPDTKKGITSSLVTSDSKNSEEFISLNLKANVLYDRQRSDKRAYMACDCAGVTAIQGGVLPGCIGGCISGCCEFGPSCSQSCGTATFGTTLGGTLAVPVCIFAATYPIVKKYPCCELPTDCFFPCTRKRTRERFQYTSLADWTTASENSFLSLFNKLVEEYKKDKSSIINYSQTFHSFQLEDVDFKNRLGGTLPPKLSVATIFRIVQKIPLLPEEKEAIQDQERAEKLMMNVVTSYM